MALPRSGDVRGEIADAYRAVAVIDGKMRVVECRDGFQWTLQRREGRRWRNLSYHRERDVLIVRSGAVGNALATLRALPRRHP